MAAFADLVRFNPTLGGTTDFIYSSAVGGCQSPAAAGMGTFVTHNWYAVSNDLTQWEVFQGVWNSATTTAARTTVLYNSSGTGTATGQSGAGTKINFSTVPQVALVALAEDLGLLTAAVKSDQVAATSTGVTVVPGVQQFHPSAAKAWAYFTVSGGVYTNQASYNVASFVKNATGDITITFTTAFTSANYAANVTSINPAAVTVATTGALTTTTIRINLFNLSAALIDGNFSVACFGAQ